MGNVIKPLRLDFGEFHRPIEPLGSKISLIKIKEPLCDKSVIIGDTQSLSVSLPPAAIERLGLGIIELFLQEARRLLGRLQVGFVSKDLISLRERGDHKAIPTAHDLVVQMRPRAVSPCLKELGLGIG